MNESVDLKALGQRVRELCPDAHAAVLAGSAAIRAGCVEDLDVTCLQENLWNRPSETTVVFEGRRLDVLIFEPGALLTLIRLSDLFLMLVREARKILQGQILFDDDGTLKRFRKSLLQTPVPLDKLLPLSNTVTTTDPWNANQASCTRLALYLGLENLVFCWLHLDIRYTYSKPKWVREDIRQLRCEPLERLGDLLAEELLRTVNVHDLVARFQQSIQEHANGFVPTGAHYQLHDACFLLDRQRDLEACWPLRMAGYLYGQWWAQKLGIPYLNLGSNLSVCEAIQDAYPRVAELLADTLMMNTRPPKACRGLWQSAKADFLQAWRSLSGHTVLRYHDSDHVRF